MAGNKLLPRNRVEVSVITGPPAPAEASPIPEDYPPDWYLEKPTPWNLAALFADCLSQVIIDGENRSLVHGIYAELRSAKALLAEYGPEDAAKIVKYLAEDVSCPVTLHRAKSRAEHALRKKLVPIK